MTYVHIHEKRRVLFTHSRAGAYFQRKKSKAKLKVTLNIRKTKKNKPDLELVPFEVITASPLSQFFRNLNLQDTY